MRAARLVSVLLLLQAKGQVTAEALAEELEVSPRTIYRDLDNLSAAGVPVYAERGKGGGYRLLDGYRTNLTGLTAEEAGALLLSGAPGPAAELGLGSLLATTRLKLLAAVPPSLREAATRAEQRFHLDPRGWAHDRARDDRFLKPIARAVWNDRRLQISYRRPDGRVAQRLIDPVGLVHKTGTWYLVAWHEGASRVYRVDRVQGAQESGEAAQRPPDFDLVRFWERWEADYAETLPAFSTRVRLGPLAQRYRDDLGPLAPRAISEHGISANGWIEQKLLFDTRRIAVSALLALAPDVEIIEPAELRDDLIAVASEMIQRTLRMDAAAPSAGSRPDLRPYLGKSVTVTVDRPLGSQHPSHWDIRYPVNYGYLAGSVSGDGAPIDAYVLGVESPLAEMVGVVVALVLRADDVEDKLVVAPSGQHFSAVEIQAAVDFQERFFESQIVTPCNAGFRAVPSAEILPAISSG
jgi:predicted DNA-binding transcriptional regulator YafY